MLLLLTTHLQGTWDVFLFAIRHWYVFDYTMLTLTFNSLTFCMNVVVGTVEGGRAPTKIKTDLKKPIVNLACHPRLPVLVAYYIFLLCWEFFFLYWFSRHLLFAR